MTGIVRLGVVTLIVGLGLGACSGGTGTDEAADGAAATEALTIVTDTGRHAFQVEIADDEEERQRGLMFRPPLADVGGMLFEFPEASEQSFWMHNTPSSLDILYIGPDGRIISIARNTTPNSDTPIPSNGAARGVLELRAGRAAEISADPGDQVIHPFFGND
jgi:hypothetical protein